MGEIYFDNAATTATYPEVAAVATEIMCRNFGNPSSLHEIGFRAQKALEKSREQLAAALGAGMEEIIFTSGGTEANNLAVFGGAETMRRRGKRIITTQVEHSSVLEPFRKLAEQGFEVVELAPLADGALDLQALEAAMDEQTVFVSAMLVNSEVGSISAIADAVKIVKKKNPQALFHTDAVQAFGKIPFSANRLGVDYLTISGHKIHVPKGIGALYIKKGVRLVPRSVGGGQEKAIRPGTENMPGICALGLGAELAARKLNEHLQHVRGLCKYFVNKAEKLPALRMNSSREGTPYICNIAVPGYRSEIMLHYLEQKGIYISSGSACSRGAKSHVLKAMGLSNQRIDSALRISFCAENTTGEIDSFFEALKLGREELLRS